MFTNSEILTLKKAGSIEIFKTRTLNLGVSCYKILLNGQRECLAEFWTKGAAIRAISRSIEN
jgi:hypothetical protein